jgi:hypothetical protein
LHSVIVPQVSAKAITLVNGPYLFIVFVFRNGDDRSS